MWVYIYEQSNREKQRREERTTEKAREREREVNRRLFVLFVYSFATFDLYSM